MPSSRKNVKDLFHIAISCCCCLLRIAAALTRAQISRVPVPPLMRGVRLLEVAMVVCRLAEESCQGCNVQRLWSRQVPLATWKPRLDLLEQPAVPVRILERGKWVIRTSLRVPPADAWVLQGVVEGTAGVVENLAYVNSTGDKVVAGGIDVVHSQNRVVDRARLGGSDSSFS